jgi:hypothetical protein
MDAPLLVDALSGPVPVAVRHLVALRIEALEAELQALRDEQAALEPLVGACWPDEPLAGLLVRMYLATGSATKVAALVKAAGLRIAGRRNDQRVVMAADVQALVAGRACDVPGTPSAALRVLLRRRAAASAKKRAWSA